MKKIMLALALGAASLASFDCAAQKTQKPEMEFPAEMAPDIKKQYQELADKGLALYQITCAKCHNDKVKGKDMIPDFTVEQLELYQIRIANATHETELQESTLNAEELANITTFFMYKKKNAAVKGRKK